MNPFTINPLPMLLGSLVLASAGFGAGWAVNGWRLKTEVADVRADVAQERAESANKALDDLAGRLEKMNGQALAAKTDSGVLNTKLDQIRKELKNVQTAKPLPVDCIPSADRVRNLGRAIEATNTAIQGAASGYVPGSTLRNPVATEK